MIKKNVKEISCIFWEISYLHMVEFEVQNSYNFHVWVYNKFSFPLFCYSYYMIVLCVIWRSYGQEFIQINI
jgi:hypothetical protein